MSDTPSTPLNDQPATQMSAGRIFHDIGTLLPALTVLAMVGGFLWFLVGLTIKPIQQDVGEIKANVMKIEEHLADLREEVATIRGMLPPHRYPDVLVEPTGANQQPPAVPQGFEAAKGIVDTNSTPAAAGRAKAVL